MLIANGIEKVKALKLPIGGNFDSPRTALVRWQSSHNEKLHQAYVNGKYAGVTVNSQQRQLIVPLPSSFATAVSIEIFAVEPKDAHIDFSDEVEPVITNGRVKLRLLRSQNLPFDSTIKIYSDSATGQIDYDNSLNAEAINVWPSRYDKCGFGNSRFGRSDFGYDSAAAVGFGRGNFGRGQFGLDADSIEWMTNQLAKGIYKFAIVVYDKEGEQFSVTETEPITVIPSPRPAERLTVISFNKHTNELLLGVS